jgi:hypothetical protein
MLEFLVFCLALVIILAFIYRQHIFSYWQRHKMQFGHMDYPDTKLDNNHIDPDNHQPFVIFISMTQKDINAALRNIIDELQIPYITCRIQFNHVIPTALRDIVDTFDRCKSSNKWIMGEGANGSAAIFASHFIKQTRPQESFHTLAVNPNNDTILILDKLHLDIRNLTIEDTSTIYVKTTNDRNDHSYDLYATFTTDTVQDLLTSQKGP